MSSSQGLILRCAGPTCGRAKAPNEEGWWVLWTPRSSTGAPVFSFCSFDERLIAEELAVPVCGESCAHKLLSQFVNNIREEERTSATNS